MGICSRCGNHIQTWAHGVCHVCERNQKDYKRFGRRRPAKRTRSVARTSSTTTFKICPICIKQVRSDHLWSHQWHAHSVTKYSTKKEYKRACDLYKQKTNVTSEQKVEGKKTKECPICGYAVPLELVVDHKLHHKLERNKKNAFQISRT